MQPETSQQQPAGQPRRRRRWVILSCALTGLLATVAWFLLRERCPGIIWQQGTAFTDLQTGKLLANGTQAAWAPNYGSMVYAREGEYKMLMHRNWWHGIAFDRALPVPMVATQYKVVWQWSFSPDMRWLAVRRQLSPGYFHEEGRWREINAEAERVHWLGVINLQSWSARVIPRRGAILGWQGYRCLLREGESKPIVAVNPLQPDKPEVLIDDSGSLSGLSPDGKWAIIYDGREGNVRVTLQELGGKPGRVIFEDPNSRTGNYGLGGSAEGSFSRDSNLVAISTLRWEGGTWQASIALESIDGRERLYEDRFDLGPSYSNKPRPLWTPVGGDRFVYFRFRRGEASGDLVIVEATAGKATASTIGLKDWQPEKRRPLPPVWSPVGDSLAWLATGRTIVMFDLASKTAKARGSLPFAATDWSGLSPRVGGYPTSR